MMLEHCQRAYELMTEDSDEYGVWEGRVSDITKLLGFSSVTGSKIFSNLRNMGCIEEMRRGAGPSVGQYKLIEFPTAQHWKHMADSGDPNVKKDGFKPRRITSYAVMATQITKLQTTLVQVIEQYNALEARVVALESKSFREENNNG